MSAPIVEVTNLLAAWEEKDEAGEDVTHILNRLAEVFEMEYYNYLKTDPDPFDDRHPNRSVPECTLGHMLKTVFRKQRFVDEMVNVYCQRDVLELNTAVCRVLLDILPGLENIMFNAENFVSKLYQWSESAPNPLQTYATGLLANAMNIAEIAANYREKNAYFIPLMLKRLHKLSSSYLHGISTDEEKMSCSPPAICESTTEGQSSSSLNVSPSNSNLENIDESTVNETSNSNWTEYRFGSYQLFPLTLAGQQKYVLEYLTPMGEYQEFLGPLIEENALLLILRYIDFTQHNDVRLAFAALKYLASLLCHKKIAFEFLSVGGLQLLLKVPRFSIAADGVSICLYYLGCHTEVLEKTCLLPSEVISDVISYALWLTECSHNSSRFHAIFFFALCFAFHPFLQNFDLKDGLRTLFNTLTMLDIFIFSNNRLLNDDDMFTSRQTAKHVCTTLKKYFEAHLDFMAESRRLQLGSNVDSRTPKAVSFTNEAVEKNIELFQEQLPTSFYRWKPVCEFLNLNGVTFLLDLIASYFEINYSGRAETIKCALDVLKICALSVEASAKFCDKISDSEGTDARTGVCILLEAAVGEKVPYAEAQRSALLTIVNLVFPKCVPVERERERYHGRRAAIMSRNKDVRNKVWKTFRIKNGINVLINLLFTKEPLSEADSIRFLACKALYGLAHAQNVTQIICKLPLITDALLINLMKEPILQDKYSDHIQFCKFGLKLIQKVTDASLAARTESSLNLEKLRASEVVAKTKIAYPQEQLLQLICDHLNEKGFTQTVQCLQLEIATKSESSNFSFCLEGLPNSNIGFKTHPPRIFHFGEIPVIPPTSVPLKIVLTKKGQNSDIQFPRPMTPDFSSYEQPKPVIKQKSLVPEPTASTSSLSPALLKRQAQSAEITSQSTISLDSIITEYLRKQHALCKNPVLSCPPFDLTVPHKCPEPQKIRRAPTNFTLRQHKHEIFGHNGGFHGVALNRKLIHSRFRLFRSIRDEDGGYDFASCAFIDDFDENNPKHSIAYHPNLLIGTDSGNVKLINIETGRQIVSRECFRAKIIDYIETRKQSKIFIVTALHRLGYAGLWKILPEEISEVEVFNDVTHLEFGKRYEEKMIATKHHSAAIYDMRTLEIVQVFPDEDLSNGYIKNRATFNYTDELVLSDGLLYDVRSGLMIHKLDQFNATLNGVFHPNNREIISNSEIWDIRTFKLLKTVAGFDKCRVSFNSVGNVIYAVGYSRELLTCGGSNSFSTYHAHDYSTIATVDVKKPIFALGLDVNDTYIATCESKNSFECRARVYEVGRTKQSSDESDDDDDNSNSDDDDNSDDSGDEEDENSDDSEGEVEVEFLENEEEANENQSEGEEDNDDDNWASSSESSDDDMEESLFALNNSQED